MTDLTSLDAPTLLLVAKWVERGETPALLPITLARQIRAIAKAIERERTK